MSINNEEQGVGLDLDCKFIDEDAPEIDDERQSLIRQGEPAPLDDATKNAQHSSESRPNNFNGDLPEYVIPAPENALNAIPSMQQQPPPSPSQQPNGLLKNLPKNSVAEKPVETIELKPVTPVPPAKPAPIQPPTPILRDPAAIKLEKDTKQLEDRLEAVCDDNDVDKIKSLVANDPNNSKLLTAHPSDGDYSVLEKACMTYPVNVLKCLLEECGADINDLSPKYGGNLLHYLPYWTNKDVFDKVKYLTDIHHLNPNKTDNDGNLAIVSAFTNDAVDVVKLFVNELGIDINHKNSKGQSLLQLATGAEAYRIASFLMEKGAKMGQLNEDDEVSCAKLLKYAIANGNVVVFNALLAAVRHDPEQTKRVADAVDKDGASLHVATGLRMPVDKRYHTKSAKDSVKDKLVTQAVQRYATMFVRELLRHGADPMVLNVDLEIPLHIAAKANDKEIADLLLAKGDIKRQLLARNIHGGTLLHTAVAANCLDIQKLFLENNECEPSVVDYKKRNVFHSAVDHGSDLQLLLLAAENDEALTKVEQWTLTLPLIKNMLVQVDRDGNTPVDGAASRGDTETVRRFLRIIEPTSADRGVTFRKAAECGKLKSCEIIGTAQGSSCLPSTDEDGNSALHLAAANGHLDVVKLLTIYQPPDKNINKRHQLPVHLAAEAGHLDVTQFLVSCDNAIANFKDIANMTPLHHAAKHNRVDVVKCLMDMGADACIRDSLGRNALDVAIDNGCFKVGQAILQNALQWRWVLMNDIEPRDLSDLTTDQLQLLGYDDVDKVYNSIYRETPLRRMIRKLPQLAIIVFDKCAPDKIGNVEFIDDTYASWKSTGKENSEGQEKVYEATGKLCKTARRYIKDGQSFKANHPLTLMIKFSRDDLLDHPLVKALTSHKCKLANRLYFVFMAIFLCMIIMATVFIVLSDPPQNFNWTVDTCAINEEHYPPVFHTRWLQLCIWVILFVCIVVEGVQLFALKVRYFLQPSNYFDWFCYVSLILITINQTDCGARTLRQWNLSAFCLLASWINMAMLLRRLPYLGIYVVMLTKVAQSFANFFTILFSFIVAFAVAFFVLLQSQVPFATLGDSLLKTAVMMTGEQDFDDIFHRDVTTSPDEQQAEDMFKAFAIVVYVIFLPTMSIIVLNLLVGLAVGDIDDLMKNAKIERLGLSVDLALDVEQNMPSIIQRKLINRYVQMRSVPRCIGRLLRATKKLIFTEISETDNHMEQLFDDVKEQVAVNARKVAKDITQQVAELHQFKKEITAETDKLKSDLIQQGVETKGLIGELLQTIKRDNTGSQSSEVHALIKELRQTLAEVKQYASLMKTKL